jgi:hypothetical protein
MEQAGVIYKEAPGQYVVTDYCFKVTGKEILDKMSSMSKLCKRPSEPPPAYRVKSGSTLTAEQRAQVVAHLREEKRQHLFSTAAQDVDIWNSCIEHAQREGADTSLILHHEAKDGVWSVWIADNMCGELVAGILEHELRKACRRLTSDASITFIYEAPPKKVASMKVVQYVYGQIDDVIREINSRSAKATKPRSEQYIIVITQVQQIDAEGRHIKNVGSKDAEELRRNGIPLCF